MFYDMHILDYYLWLTIRPLREERARAALLPNPFLGLAPVKRKRKK